MPYDLGNVDGPTECREPGDAPGVEYSTSDYAPGLKLFRCEPYKATLSTRSCGQRWEKAQDGREDTYARSACRTCSIGAAHAGRGFVLYSKHHGSPICARCGRGGFRMIGNRVCVSCYNRARELRLGKNGRGHVPVELLQRPLHTLAVLVDIDGEVHRHRDRETLGMIETMVQVLRTRTGTVAFGFAGAGIQGAQSGPASMGQGVATPREPPATHGSEIRVAMNDGDDGVDAAAARDVEASTVPRRCSRLHRQLFASTAIAG